MEEKKLILLPADGRKGIIMGWSEVLSKFDITSRRLTSIVEKGELVKGFYIDEALTRK